MNFEEKIFFLKAKAKKIRCMTVKLAHTGKSAHVASALSCVDIMTTLFYNIMERSRDRFILSKGHGCMSYYAILSEKGYIGCKELDTYSRNGSFLAEHPLYGKFSDIELATGSLGHGLSFSAGAALARKICQKEGTEFVLLSDGECNEGSVWEAAMVASNLNLDNLVAVVDYNKMQCAGFCDKTPMYDKWEAFGWEVYEARGNCVEDLLSSFSFCFEKNNKPKVIIAHTTKGKGVPFMENDILWHYRPPNEEELQLALDHLNNNA